MKLYEAHKSKLTARERQEVKHTIRMRDMDADARQVIIDDSDFVISQRGGSKRRYLTHDEVKEDKDPMRAMGGHNQKYFGPVISNTEIGTPDSIVKWMEFMSVLEAFLKTYLVANEHRRIPNHRDPAIFHLFPPLQFRIKNPEGFARHTETAKQAYRKKAAEKNERIKAGFRYGIQRELEPAELAGEGEEVDPQGESNRIHRFFYCGEPYPAATTNEKLYEHGLNPCSATNYRNPERTAPSPRGQRSNRGLNWACPFLGAIGCLFNLNSKS